MEQSSIKLPVDFHPVDSSRAKAIAYFENGPGAVSLIKNFKTKDIQVRPAGRLEVIFPPKKDGSCARWAYYDVPSFMVVEMLEADSLGKYLGDNIIKMPHAYTASKLGEIMPTVEEDFLSAEQQAEIPGAQS